MRRSQLSQRPARLFVVAVITLMTLVACGGGSKSGAQMQWVEGPPPTAVQNQAAAAPAVSAPATHAAAPTDAPDRTTATAAATQETQALAAAPKTTEPAPAFAPLTADQLKTYKPNELGLIPVLEYHVLTNDSNDNQQFVRPIEKFRGDLQWLYDHNFYVISFHDMINNHVTAPAGKHPFVITFDDSTTGQFRYLIAADGSVTIDPNSGVGVMEEFFAKHPDFGHTAFFAVIATDSLCFDWQGTQTDVDQEKFCGQKMTWLLDHGYEVGNHTVHHANLFNVSDDVFLAELGGDFEWAKAKDPRAYPDILAMPFGTYPDLATKKQQRTWLRDGFSYKGVDYKLIGVLNVGSNPSPTVDSTDWDAVFIPRIQAFDADAKIKGGGGFDTWFPDFAARPESLYTSDGDPDTITVPNKLPIDVDGTLNTDAIAAEGKKLIRYDG